MFMRADTQLDNGPRRRFIAVDWQECAWQPRIEVRRPLPPRRRAAARSWFAPPPGFYSPRRNFIYSKTMKINLPYSRRNRAGFTLVELLAVISIIGILAGLLLPVLHVASTHAKMVKAHLEAVDIVTAIQAYDSAYGRFPVSAAAQNQAVANASARRSPNGDFTYGGNFSGNSVFTLGCQMTNAEVIAILMDITNYPNGTPTINTNYVKNPQQKPFLNAKMSGYNPVAGGFPLPGVGTDLVYRDPWGNPYVISMDLNYDGMCQDAFYCLARVSQQSGATGWNGLVSSGNPQNLDDYKYRGTVMAWSAGPDGKIDPTTASNQGFNKDNVLSWQQ
jgi:prepilin-type N-terminal cleavage/methylation domain-containing protein